MFCIWIYRMWSVNQIPSVNIQVGAHCFIVGILTGILWARDRRTVKPGHYNSCGYNLTGNESGVCPECATPVPKQETTA